MCERRLGNAETGFTVASYSYRKAGIALFFLIGQLGLINKLFNIWPILGLRCGYKVMGLKLDVLTVVVVIFVVGIALTATVHAMG